MADFHCPVSKPARVCPYPDGGFSRDPRSVLCHLACVDSWDGDHSFVRRGDSWEWTGDQHTVPVTYPSPPATKPRPGVLPFGRRRRKRR